MVESQPIPQSANWAVARPISYIEKKHQWPLTERAMFILTKNRGNSGTCWYGINSF